MNTSIIYQELTVLIAEDIALVPFFVLLECIIAVPFKRIGTIPSFQRYHRIGDTIQRRFGTIAIGLVLMSVLAATAFNSYLIFFKLIKEAFQREGISIKQEQVILLRSDGHTDGGV